MNGKTYSYKWYTGAVFNGLLDNVSSAFNLTQEINTAGSQIEIELAKSFQDSNPQITTDLLITETGDFIVSTDLENIVVGSDISVSGIPALNDRIEVWEFSDSNINGSIIFNGLVSRWSSSYKNNITRITVLSYGVQLDNFLVQILPQESIAQQLTQNAQEIIYGEFKTPVYDRVISVSQTFIAPSATDISGIYLQLYKSGSGTGGGLIAQLQVIEGTPLLPGAVLTTKQVLVTVDTIDLSLFTFSSAVSLIQSSTYHIRVTSPFGSNLSESSLLIIGYDSVGGYVDGQMFVERDIAGITTPGDDIYFQLLSDTGGIGNVFNSYDPGNIVKELLDNFVSLGGLVTYDDSINSVLNTGTTVSYTFKYVTYMDALKKCIELSPQNWWWYVDAKNGTVYFKPLSQVVSHTFVNDKHLSDLNITYSLEQIVNQFYFSGGDIGGGVNLLVNKSNQDSISSYGTWLKSLSDNRVTTESTGEIISESLVNQFKDPRFNTTITIPSNVYDISTINIGQIVSFSNFNSLIDSLELQIMRLTTTPDEATIVLAILPPTQSKRIEDIKRNLDKVNTVDNPDQ